MNRKLTLSLTAAAVAGVVGGAALIAGPSVAASVAGPQAKGSTGITMSVTNQTQDTMHLVSATNLYGHWQQRATDIAPGATSTVSNYSDSIEGSNIELTYKMSDGTVVDVSGVDSLTGGDSIGGSSSNTARYVVHGQNGKGFHPTFTFQVQEP